MIKFGQKSFNILMRRLILIFVFASLMVFADSIIVNSQPVTWNKTWGIPNRVEEGKRVVQTFDGGYAVLTIVSYGGGNDYFNLIKYDYLGNLLWIKVIVDSTSRMLWDMQQTSDSGFIFAGWSSGALLVKTDKNGNLKWQRNYTNLNSGTRFGAVKQTTDNGYIACGYYTDYVEPSGKGIVIKTDSLGYVKWERQYMDSLDNSYGDIMQGIDGLYYISGSTKNNYPSLNYALLKKIDSLGNVIWTNIFYVNGGGGNITQLRDGSLIVSGSTTVYIYTYRPILAKFDTIGNMKWVHYYYPTPYLWYRYMTKDLFDNIILTGLYTETGYNETIGIWKLDTGGTIIKTKTLSFSGYSSIYSSCIKSTSDSGFIISGNAFVSSINNADALIIKTDSAFNTTLITNINNISSSYPEDFKLEQNYPNPFNSFTTIKFSLPNNGYANINLYDMLGKRVFSNTEYRNKGFNEKQLDFENINLCSGIYFIQVIFNSKSKLIKVVYLK